MHLAPAFVRSALKPRQFSLARTSAMPLASRSSATEPFTDCDRMVEAAVTAALAAAARTSASAWASASAILLSAVLVRRATKSSSLALASAAMRSASALAEAMMSWASRSALAWRALYSRQQLGGLVLEAAGVVEFGLDALAAMIERRQHGAMDAEIGEHAIRMTKATATQNSGSENIDLSLQRRVDGAARPPCRRAARR